MEAVEALCQEEEHAVVENDQEVSQSNDTVIEDADPQITDPHVAAETRDEFLERAALCIRQAGVADEALALFETFQTTDDLGLTFATFAHMHLHAARLPLAGDSSPLLAEHRSASAEEQAPRFPYQLFQELLGNNWKESLGA